MKNIDEILEAKALYEKACEENRVQREAENAAYYKPFRELYSEMETAVMRDLTPTATKILVKVKAGSYWHNDSFEVIISTDFWHTGEQTENSMAWTVVVKSNENSYKIMIEHPSGNYEFTRTFTDSIGVMYAVLEDVLEFKWEGLFADAYKKISEFPKWEDVCVTRELPRKDFDLELHKARLDYAIQTGDWIEGTGRSPEWYRIIKINPKTYQCVEVNNYTMQRAISGERKISRNIDNWPKRVSHDDFLQWTKRDGTIIPHEDVIESDPA